MGKFINNGPTILKLIAMMFKESFHLIFQKRFSEDINTCIMSVVYR